MPQQPNLYEHIVVDTSDEDSLCDAQSIVDSSLTLSSSVRDYCYENGRRYHAYRHGEYPMPNDEEEQERLTLMHHLFKLLIGGDLYRAPIFEHDLLPGLPPRVLDVGTGTGVWALEIAEIFPDVEIVGTDLSPIQPSWAPPNCSFHIDDAESDWTFAADEAFDYIHARTMGGAIGDWDRFLRQAYSHLKPGGWIEIQEYEAWFQADDGTLHAGHLLSDWQEKLDTASCRFGKRMNIAPHLLGWMRDAGFANATDDVYKCPVGSWPKSPRLKEIGRVGKVTTFEAVEPYSLALFTRVLGWTFEEAQMYVNKVRAELLSSSYHSYVLFHYVYGQRPVDG